MSTRKKISYLKQYKHIDNYVTRLLEEKEQWRLKAEKMTSTISDMPISPAWENQREEAICRMVECEQEAVRLLEELVELRKNIENAIKGVGRSDLALLLSYRYIDGKRWEEIAYLLGCSWRHVHRKHSEALEELKMA